MSLNVTERVADNGKKMKDQYQMEKRQLQDEVKKTPNVKREVYYTPETAFEYIEPYVKDFKTIWDPAAGSDKYPVKEFFDKKGHRVVTTDIIMGKEFDFLTQKTKKRIDLILTTPPYSYRKDFIIRACELKKPFAMLVPWNVGESKTVRELFKEHNISILLPPKTTVFSSPDDSKSVKTLPYSMWITCGIPKVPEIVYL